MYELLQTAGGAITETDPIFNASPAKDITTGHITVLNSTSGTNSGDTKNRAISIEIDGQGTAPTAGLLGFITVPYSGTITGWTILSDVAGSCVVDIKKTTYADYPTASSIAGSEKPTLSTASKNQDNTLTTWTTSLSAGDILAINLDSASTLTKIYLSINVEATS